MKTFSSFTPGRSCFDAAYPVRNYFWSMIDSKQQSDYLKSMAVLYEGTLFVDGIEKQHCFQIILKDSMLYYQSLDSETVHGMIKLDFQRTELIRVEKKEGTWYALKLKSSASETVLLHQDRNVITKWRKHLRPFVVNHDFSSLYHKGDLIGRGAFSKVFKAVHLKSGLTFAAKILDHNKIFEDEATDRLVRQEIEIMRSLDHPCIPKLREVYETDSQVVLLMDYVDGFHFDDPVTKTLTPGELVEVSWSLLKVLDYLHEKKVVHRDIKPENLLIVKKSQTERIQLKLLDFGLSVYQNQKLIYSKCGTPGYVAPETLKNKYFQQIEADSRSDIYSAGMVLFELVYGYNPFIPEEDYDLEQILENNAQSCFSIPDLPAAFPASFRGLAAVLSAMLQKQSDSRPLAADLLEEKVFKNGGCEWEGKDYSILTDEDLVNKQSTVAYKFKANKSKFKAKDYSSSSSEGTEGDFLAQKSIFARKYQVGDTQ